MDHKANVIWCDICMMLCILLLARFVALFTLLLETTGFFACVFISLPRWAPAWKSCCSCADIFTVLLRTRWLMERLSHVHLQLHKVARLLPSKRRASELESISSQRLSEWALSLQVLSALLRPAPALVSLLETYHLA
jgi:hypothetical protein